MSDNRYTVKPDDIEPVVRIKNERAALYKKRLLITGSRDVPSILMPQIKHVVLGAFFTETHIVVGDADGVDSIVVALCNNNGVDYTCYGISVTGKNPNARWYERVYSNRGKGAPLERNEVMVHNADACYAFWNGHSTGTKYTYDYARKQGLVTRLYIPQHINYFEAEDEDIRRI